MRDNPWRGLPPGAPGTLSALRIPEAGLLQAFWARKPDGRLALLIAVQDVRDAPIDLPTVRGVEISFSPPERQLQLVLTSAGDWEMFHVLCLDLLAATNEAADELGALGLLFTRLRRWQRLLSKGHGRLLDEREVRGLIGELVFLRDRVLPVAGARGIVCWQGPMGLPQDFVHEGRLIEVKTYSAGSSPAIRIASPEQLSSVDVPLFLHVICLVKQEDALTLPGLVEDIRRVLDGDAVGVEALEERLVAVGYMDLPEYRSMSYAMTSATDYEVRSGFPCLKVSDIPAGVVDVAYSIQLDAMSRFVVDAATAARSAGELA